MKTVTFEVENRNTSYKMRNNQKVAICKIFKIKQMKLLFILISIFFLAVGVSSAQSNVLGDDLVYFAGHDSKGEFTSMQINSDGNGLYKVEFFDQAGSLVKKVENVSSQTVSIIRNDLKDGTYQVILTELVSKEVSYTSVKID